MAGIAKKLFIARQEMGRCPICNEFINETFKNIVDKQYGNVCFCNTHLIKTGGK